MFNAKVGQPRRKNKPGSAFLGVARILLNWYAWQRCDTGL
jgi:hypothetical protein